MDNYSLSDVAAVTRNGYGYGDGCGFGGGGARVLIILFALIFGWGGNGWGGRGGAEPVTEAGLCNSMNFNNLENAVGRLNDNQAAIARQTDNAICQLGYQAAQLSNQTQRDLCQGFTNIASQLADCCYAVQRGIDQANYNGAMNTATINANTTAGVQKILDKMCENETNALRARVQQLELQSAMCGVVRYPTSTTFATTCNPFFCGFGFNNCGCGCNGNI